MKRFLVIIFTMLAMTNPAIGSEESTSLLGGEEFSKETQTIPVTAPGGAAVELSKETQIIPVTASEESTSLLGGEQTQTNPAIGSEAATSFVGGELNKGDSNHSRNGIRSGNFIRGRRRLLKGKLTKQTLDALVSLYEDHTNEEKEKAVKRLERTLDDIKDPEFTAYSALLSVLASTITGDAINYWFYKPDAQSFPWYKIVKNAIESQHGIANDFMAYLYDLNIKGKNKKEIQEINEKSGIRIENGYYMIGGKYENNQWSGGLKFKKVPSFLQKHWRKLATGAAIGVAVPVLYDIGSRIEGFRDGGGAWGSEYIYSLRPKRGYLESPFNYYNRSQDWRQKREREEREKREREERKEREEREKISQELRNWRQKREREEREKREREERKEREEREKLSQELRKMLDRIYYQTSR